MKRRNAECGKLRRPLKKNKITEGMYGSTFLYVKFFMLWAFVILADFILEFRFEFLWPFWLLLRSVYDSFKYQGLAFSAFFICISITSDMICFFFIPVNWLFFAASTYVWVQYVWHTEKGICLPTIILWLVFVYVEAAVRLRDLRHIPFHMDLCRPFAAHCIGYPVVTLGFGFKSYLSYRMRQRRQKQVSKENDFYFQLLLQALPHEQTNPSSSSALPNGISEKSKVLLSTETQANGHGPHHHSNKNNHRKSVDKVTDTNKFSQTNGTDIEFMEKLGKKFPVRSSKSVNDFDENEADKEKSFNKSSLCKSNNSSSTNNSSKWPNSSSSSNKEQSKESSSTQNEKRRNKVNKESSSSIPANDNSPKEEYNNNRLENDLKRLRIELQAARASEQELRQQINTLTSSERSQRNTLSQLQADNESLQQKLHGLVTARQADKNNVAQLEKRLSDERRTRSNLEAQLTAERKNRKAEEAATARAIAMAAAAAAAKSEQCSESCRARRRDLESEVKLLRRELKTKEERCCSAEMELQMLRPYKDSHNDAEVLYSALSAMQDKNVHLENSLSAETRIKLDLFSALGECKRQIEIKENVIHMREKEVDELKSKIAQVVAVADSLTPAALDFVGHSLSGSASSKLLLAAASELGCNSNLDPNATAYTPKSTNITSTEA